MLVHALMVTVLQATHVVTLCQYAEQPVKAPVAACMCCHAAVFMRPMNTIIRKCFFILVTRTLYSDFTPHPCR